MICLLPLMCARVVSARESGRPEVHTFDYFSIGRAYFPELVPVLSILNGLPVLFAVPRRSTGTTFQPQGNLI